MDIKPDDITFSPASHAECVFITNTSILMIDTKIPINIDDYFKVPEKALELKDYILKCQDRKVFCEVSKELIDYAIGYGTIRLSQLPKNEKIIEAIKKQLLTPTGQTNYITAWNLEQILKEFE